MYTISKEINMHILGCLFTFFLMGTCLVPKFYLTNLTSITKYDAMK